MNSVWKYKPGSDPWTIWRDRGFSPPKRPAFTVAADGVSLYRAMADESDGDVAVGITIGRVCAVLGIPEDRVETHVIGPHAEWLVVRFMSPEDAGAFRMACPLSFKTEITEADA